MGCKAKGVDKAKRNFRLLADGTRLAPKIISQELADSLEESIYEYYDQWWGTLLESQFPEEHLIWVTQVPKKSGIRVIVEGTQLLYDEFGTGDVGEQNSHPTKNLYDLDPYNSGPWIFEGADGKHYWYYQGQLQNGQKAGRFVYDAVNDIVYNKVEDFVDSYFSSLL